MFSPYNYLFLFSTLLSPIFLTSTTADLVKNICSGTQNPTFCVDFLGHVYRPGESLSDLAKDAIQTSTTYVFLVQDDIQVREKEAFGDPVLKNKYHECGVSYTSALKALGQWRSLLQSGDDYNKLVSLASLALKQPANCDSVFAGSDPDHFKKLNQAAGYVCSIVLAVSQHLASGDQN